MFPGAADRPELRGRFSDRMLQSFGQGILHRIHGGVLLIEASVQGIQEFALALPLLSLLTSVGMLV
jgi:hypothetical protein